MSAGPDSVANLPVSPSIPSRGNYWPALDGLRGCSILGVMLYHLGAGRGGALGLTAFFVLSGFLITRLLLIEWDSTGGVSFRSFYMRRILRLSPALFTLLVVLAVATALGLTAGPFTRAHTFAEIGLALVYLTNLAASFGWFSFHYLGHTWSLATEEQFYVIWPTLLALLLRRRWKPWSIVGLALGLAAFSSVLRAAVYHNNSEAVFNRATFAPDTRAGELMIGCATAVILHYALILVSVTARRTIRLAAWVSVPMVLVLARKSGHNLFTFRYTFTLVALAVGVTIIDMRLSPGTWRERALALAPLVWVGKMSYGLYLWHFPVFYFVDEHHVTGSKPTAIVVKLAITFGIASASYYLIETRFLRLKARYGHNPPQGQTEAQAAK